MIKDVSIYADELRTECTGYMYFQFFFKYFICERLDNFSQILIERAKLRQRRNMLSSKYLK